MSRRMRTDGKPPGTKRTDKKKPVLPAARVTASATGSATVVLDPDILFELAKTHASFDQLALIFGCSAMLLSDETKQWRPIIDRARAEQQKNLLSAQFNIAINDRNPTMQIWLGKQYLDQRDTSRTEHTGPDGGPVKTEADVTTRAVAYIPDNGRNPTPKSPALPDK